MGLYTLTSYSPSQCASYCNQVSNCLGFNIYYERDPSLNPGAACPNPASQTNIKCTLYGSQVSAASATNTGQYRAQFHVVIAGSNGYNRIVLPAPVQNAYNNPAALAGAIDYSQGYIGSRFFNQPFDAGVCAALCSATTADNRAVAQAQYTGPGGSFDGSYQGALRLCESSLSTSWSRADVMFFCSLQLLQRVHPQRKQRTQGRLLRALHRARPQQRADIHFVFRWWGPVRGFV